MISIHAIPLEQGLRRARGRQDCADLGCIHAIPLEPGLGLQTCWTSALAIALFEVAECTPLGVTPLGVHRIVVSELYGVGEVVVFCRLNIFRWNLFSIQNTFGLFEA